MYKAKEKLLTDDGSRLDGVDSIQEALHVPWTVVDKCLLVHVHFLSSVLESFAEHKWQQSNQ